MTKKQKQERRKGRTNTHNVGEEKIDKWQASELQAMETGDIGDGDGGGGNGGGGGGSVIGGGGEGRTLWRSGDGVQAGKVRRRGSIQKRFTPPTSHHHDYV